MTGWVEDRSEEDILIPRPCQKLGLPSSSDRLPHRVRSGQPILLISFRLQPTDRDFYSPSENLPENMC